jgi:hypothetical protein
MTCNINLKSLAMGLGLLVLCGAVGCATTEPGKQRRLALPCVVLADPCHGYHPTCWQPWSACCPPCPASEAQEWEKVDFDDDSKGIHVIPPPPTLEEDKEVLPAPEAKQTKRNGLSHKTVELKSAELKSAPLPESNMTLKSVPLPENIAVRKSSSLPASNTILKSAPLPESITMLSSR